MSDVVYVACASAYSRFGTTEGLRQAQKNIFTYPANVESWASFIAAVLPRSEPREPSLSMRPSIVTQLFEQFVRFLYRCTSKNSKPDIQWLSSLISIVRSQFQTSEHMSEWLLRNAQEIAACSS